MWVQAHAVIWQSRVLLCMLIVLFAVSCWTFQLEAGQMLRKSIVTQPSHRQQPQSVIQIVSADDPPRNRSADSKLQSESRVAICLVGGLGAFELSSASLRKNLLNAYGDADVFIHAPVDTDVHKLTLLSSVSSRLAFVRISFSHALNESNIIRELLTPRGSLHGIQGLLQYFNLVEGCLDLIDSYERRNQFKYDWIIRTRIDTYWNAPMPSIQALNLDASKYHVPFDLNYHGMNDILGIGSRETSRVALKRMTSLPMLHQQGLRNLNSEMSFKAQFTVRDVDVEQRSFPFCVLTMGLRYRFSPRRSSQPLLSALSKGPLNGSKCRLCVPALIGEEAGLALHSNEAYVKNGGMNSNILTEGPQTCDATLKWDVNSTQIFDTLWGPESAEERKWVTFRSQSACVLEMQSLRLQSKMWDAPSVESLCLAAKAARRKAGHTSKDQLH